MYDKTYTRDEKFAVLDSAIRIVKKILEMVDKEPQVLQNSIIIKVQDLLSEMKTDPAPLKFSDRYEINKDKWEKKIWDKDSVQLSNGDNLDENTFKYILPENAD